jgi:hypothetical protein
VVDLGLELHLLVQEEQQEVALALLLFPYMLYLTMYEMCS